MSGRVKSASLIPVFIFSKSRDPSPNLNLDDKISSFSISSESFISGLSTPCSNNITK